MTYGPIETSEEWGAPVALYLFTYGEQAWRYTSADSDVTAGGYTWLSVPIQDDGIKQTGEAATDALQVTATSDIEPAQLYMDYAPSGPMSLAILQYHEGDDQVVTKYVGEVTQHNTPSPGTSIFSVETRSASMQREGLRLGWQRACPYALYDPLTCRVDRSLWGVAGVITAVSDMGEVVIAELASRPDGTFNGGFIEWVVAGRGKELRGIEEQVGSIIKMFGTTEGLEVGQAVTAYPGCARTQAACRGFDNLPNYGGAPFMPGKSPFDGDPVF